MKTASTDRVASVTGRRSSADGSGPVIGGRPASIASATARSVPVIWFTDFLSGTGAPRPTARETVVTESSSSSRPTTAGHQTAARRLIRSGSDNVRWNSARRSESERNA